MFAPDQASVGAGGLFKRALGEMIDGAGKSMGDAQQEVLSGGSKTFSCTPTSRRRRFSEHPNTVVNDFFNPFDKL